MPDDDHPEDELRRDEFYGSDIEDEDEDDEYELEPPDAEVLASEKRHAERTVADAEGRIDVDDLFRGEEQYDHDKLLKDIFRSGKLRFRTKHLMWATALLAVFMAIGQVAGYGLPLFILFIVGVSAALFYLGRQERLHQEALEQKKQAFRDEMRRRAAGNSAPAPDEAEVEWHDTREKQPAFHFSFSSQEIMIAIALAVVGLGMLILIGPFGVLLLGLVGLAANAAGFEPPPVVTLGWWLLLALYVVVSLGIALFGGSEAAAAGMGLAGLAWLQREP